MTDVLQIICDSSRRRILSSLRRRPHQEVTVDEVSAEHGLHRTVAFGHLERLADAGLLIRGSRRTGRGRPARTYSHDGEAIEVSDPPRRHRLLASLLGAGISRVGTPAIVAAVQEARALGERFASGSAGPAHGLARISELGAPYRLTDAEIAAQDCVFREACAAAPGVVCAVHAGLIEGALAASGAPCTIRPLGPDGMGGCRFEMTSGAGPSPAAIT